MRMGRASRESCPGCPVTLRWAVELWKRETLECAALGAAGRPGPWLGFRWPLWPLGPRGFGGSESTAGPGAPERSRHPPHPWPEPSPRQGWSRSSSLGTDPRIRCGPHSGLPALRPPLSLPASTHSAPGTTEAARRPSLTPSTSEYQRSIASPRKPALATQTMLGASSRLHSPMPPCFPAHDLQHGGHLPTRPEKTECQPHVLNWSYAQCLAQCLTRSRCLISARGVNEWTQCLTRSRCLISAPEVNEWARCLIRSRC